MKKILSVLMLIFSTFFATAQEITISGKAPKGATEISLLSQRSMITPIINSNVDEKGCYVIKLAADRASLLYLTQNLSYKYIPIYAKPGDKIVVDFDGENVTFSGSQAENNRFLALLDQEAQRVHKAIYAPTADIIKYRDMMIEIGDAILTFIDNAHLKDQHFSEILKLNRQLLTANSILTSESSFKLANKGMEVQLPKDYYQSLVQLSLDSPSLHAITFLPWFLNTYFSTMELYGLHPTDLNNYLLMRASKIGNERAKEEYLLHEYDLFQYGYNQHYATIANSIEPLIRTKEGKAKFKEMRANYDKMALANQQFNYGQPAFALQAPDSTGKIHSLSDYKGTVILIDVWDTGCTPCIAEMPALATLEHTFSGKPVTFISLSLDRDRAKWMKFMQERTMTGIQLNDTMAQKSGLAQYYKLRGIPRFLVIGKDGTIVETNAPRPSDPKLKLLIEQELTK